MSTAVTATLGSDIDLSEPGAALPAPGLSNPGLSSLAPLHRLAEARRQKRDLKANRGSALEDLHWPSPRRNRRTKIFR